MRWFLSTRIPPIGRMLLVESGPRAEADTLVPVLRGTVCGDAPIDLFTCLPDEPDGLDASTKSWRSYHASTYSERWRMLLHLRRARHTAVAILCGGSPLLAAWKLVLAVALPAKVLLVDKAEGMFWLDVAHWQKAARLAVSRSGIRNPEFLRRVAQLAALPFALLFLAGFAAKAHMLRIARGMRPAERFGRDS